MINAIQGMTVPQLTGTQPREEAQQNTVLCHTQQDEQDTAQQTGYGGESRSPSLNKHKGAVLYQTVEAMKETEDDINMLDVEYLGCSPLRPMMRDNSTDSRRERNLPPSALSADIDE
ncbi:hypothetical protein [Morganella psychrotolerans]|uniref:hypothetical protein n=1 Tax=Morganella psychrotolerans TaxID=368603 RepID=UPI0039AF2054